ncbi:MAG: hypothetical protein L6R41_007183, partial [Letrouitia leprolyta]
YNFSTYTVFWDNLLGTTWVDRTEAGKRYKRITAELSKEKKKPVGMAVSKVERVD